MDSDLPGSSTSLHSSARPANSVRLGVNRRPHGLPYTPSTFNPGMSVWFRHVDLLDPLIRPKLVLEPECCVKDWGPFHSASVSSWAIDRVAGLSGSGIDADGWPDIYSPHASSLFDVSNVQPYLPSAMRCLICKGIRGVHEFASHLFKHACSSAPIILQIGLRSQSGEQLKSAISFVPLTCKDNTYSVYWIPTEFVLSKFFTYSGMESLYRTPADPKDLFYLYLIRYYTPEAINCFKQGLPPVLC